MLLHLGSYELSYDYSDSNGNAASTVTRTVTVVDTTAPVLTIIGDENMQGSYTPMRMQVGAIMWMEAAWLPRVEV
jgi:hypothetical protein